ncbi:uncharacterized protein LOC132757031 [Ruditapes philippinarum]|uniref:uncharacterized protein LOC132757031 n=1 Tax=Ruditapes philippinarum TaxID=129788 RepID=UPI00295A5F8C|nr:uncharacterized protein LOC132757031 [Ruditapes philippinarum]
MVRGLVVILLALTFIQTVNANASLCKGKKIYDRCGTENKGTCVCSDRNVITYSNSGETSCKNIVCKIHMCYSYSGRDAVPKMGENGQLLNCNYDADCGKNFVCTQYNYCCPMPKGKHSDLLTDDPYGK